MVLVTIVNKWVIFLFTGFIICTVLQSTGLGRIWLLVAVADLVIICLRMVGF